MPEIHTTEFKTFKRCRRKWCLTVLAGLRPKKVNMNFMLGSAVHAFLEAFYTHDGAAGGNEAYLRGMDAYYEFLAEDIAAVASDPELWAYQEESIVENILLGEEMLAGYINFAAANDQFRVVKGGGKPLTEIRFEEPVLDPKGKDTGIVFAGTIDGIIRDDSGFWLFEHKTAKQIKTSHLRQEEQATNYMAWAVQKWPKLKGQLRGVLYNYLRKQAPSPRVTAPLFHRERIYRNQHELDFAQDSMYYVIQDMLRVADDPDHYGFPTPNMDCSWDCSHREICMAMNDGTNVEVLIEVGYAKDTSPKDRTWVHDWMPRSL